MMDSCSVRAVAFFCHHIQNNPVIKTVQGMDMVQSFPSTLECREIHLHMPLCAITGVMIMQRGISWCDINVCTLRKWGHAVAQSVEAPHYKPEDRGFNSRWCRLNFSLT